MNRKKTGTGPDRNRLQPDLRLRFIRPENFTGCGSSQFGKWVNRYRAGWDRSQPVFTATTSHDLRQRELRQRRPDGYYDHPSDTRADCCDADIDSSDRPQQRQPQNNHAPSPTTNDHDHQHRVDNHNHNCTNNLANNTSTTTATIKTITHRQPQGRHIDNGDTSTAATSTNRQRRRSAATTTRRQRRRRHIDSRNNNTTTAATSTRRQPPAATSSHQQP
ncbi:hypothetical protein EDB85DRAFT_1887308 [Lactarius pseudohatsudake]|nr:hypothetical protein EDB85DRAFT_1887308 [Lactarius pseudohatsudake]